eukprot:12386539-Karenia_brevis.AAC.1
MFAPHPNVTSPVPLSRTHLPYPSPVPISRRALGNPTSTTCPFGRQTPLRYPPSRVSFGPVNKLGDGPESVRVINSGANPPKTTKLECQEHYDDETDVKDDREDFEDDDDVDDNANGDDNTYTQMYVNM